MDKVWPGVVVTDDSLAQCIKEIRRETPLRRARLAFGAIGTSVRPSGLCEQFRPVGQGEETRYADE